MRIIGNLLWWLFGGLEAAIGYFTGSLALACTIIGIPFALQTIKLGLLCLWPFGSTVRETDSPTGCIRIPLNIIWLICGGLWACLQHLLFGFLLCITIIGIPWGNSISRWLAFRLRPSARMWSWGCRIIRKNGLCLIRIFILAFTSRLSTASSN